MTIKPTSNIDYDLASIALSTFMVDKTLTFNVNRPRSLTSFQVCSAPLLIHRSLRNKCLENTTAKVHEQSEYFFSDLEGKTHYLNNETIDEFTRIAREKFPDIKYLKTYAVVDTKEDVSLMPEEIVPEGFATLESDHLSIALKVNGFIAKIIPTEGKIA